MDELLHEKYPILRILGQNPGMMTGSGTNTYVLGRKEPILIDTGGGVPRYDGILQDCLQRHGIPAISRILLTHFHSDHAGGVGRVRSLFPEARVYRMTPQGKGDQPLGDGSRVHGDGFSLIALHTPGHAPDHLCYYLEEEQALFTGDLIVGEGTVVIPSTHGDMSDYLNSLERLLAWKIRVIYPGHGPVITRPREKILEYLQHRRQREEQVLEAVASGARTAAEIVRRVYSNISTALHGVAEESVLSHLKKLEKEGRVRRHGPCWSLT